MAHSDPPSQIASTALLEQVFRDVVRRSYSSGLNPAQWAALRFFAETDLRLCTAGEFAKFHRTTKGTAGQTIAALGRKSYLRRSRSTEDRRITYIHVTPEGRRQLERDPMAPIMKVVASLPPRDAEVMEVILKRILQSGP